MDSRDCPIEAMRDLLIHLRGRITATEINDMRERELIVTPFDGAYGNAGHVVALNGSPPRGLIVSLERWSCGKFEQWYPPPIFYLAMDKSKRMGEAQCRTVREYLFHHLSGGKLLDE